MTWIKTVPLSEASAELLRALEAQRPLYLQEYEARPYCPLMRNLQGSWIAQPDTRCLISCFFDLRCPDVAGLAALSQAARDDHHHSVGDQPVFLLN
jgi:hypothetical protein